jgi:hypothetical protein
LWGNEQIGVRQFISMIQWLPPESAMWRSMGKSWTTENELQAMNIEMLDSYIKLYVQANSKPNSTRKFKPLHIPRPWDKNEKSERKGTSINELIHKGLNVKKAKGGE